MKKVYGQPCVSAQILSSSNKKGSGLQLKTLWNDTLTVFWGDWLDLRVRLVQVAASGLVSPLIYIVGFGLGLGSALDATMKPAAGDNYLQFILPGMVALSSMVISFGGTTFSICGDRLFTKTFEELMLMPIHPFILGRSLSVFSSTGLRRIKANAYFCGKYTRILLLLNASYG